MDSNIYRDNFVLQENSIKHHALPSDKVRHSTTSTDSYIDIDSEEPSTNDSPVEQLDFEQGREHEKFRSKSLQAKSNSITARQGRDYDEELEIDLQNELDGGYIGDDEHSQNEEGPNYKPAICGRVS